MKDLPAERREAARRNYKVSRTKPAELSQAIARMFEGIHGTLPG
jgi:hypothetical protein